MILVDYRDGSKDLIAPMTKVGLPVESADLNSGDVAWIGRGEKGKATWIGIEHKKLPDLLQSLRSNRLNEQVRKMVKDYRFRYLFVEGELRTDTRGMLMQRAGWRREWTPIPGAASSAEVFKRLYVLQLQYGLTPIYVPNQAMAVKHIEFLYRVWTDQDLDQHKSHLGIYEPPAIIEPSEFVRSVRAWPECGLKVAHAAQGVFRSVRRAANASAAQWAALETEDTNGKRRKVGSSTADKIVTHLTKEY